MLISAPAKGVDLTVVYGVNDDKLTAEHKIVSNASCTTNCLAPVAKVLNDAIGIERGLMTTVHAYTNDQKILDQIHPDLRRARAAAMSMIPTTTGAARAVGEVLPELKGKLDGSAIRVPVPDVSLIDLTFTPKRDTTRDEVNEILKAASESEPLKGILDYTDEPLVSIDLMHTRASSTIDSLETAVLEGKLVRVVSWYDNEWGFSNRMVDTAAAMAKLGDASVAAAAVQRSRVRRPSTICREDLDDSGKTSVLVRVDLNVPMDGAKVTDDTRLRAMLPTVLELSDRGAIVLLLSHFGRPKGESAARHVDGAAGAPDPPARGRSVRFIEDCQGPEAERAIATMLPGNIGVLENTRFHAGEEKNDPALAEGDGGARRFLRQRCLLGRAPRPCLDRGASRTILPSFAGRAMEAELKALERRSAIPSGRSRRSSAAPRSRPSSPCSATSSARSII